MATERLAPDVVLVQVNLGTNGVTAIDEDPDAPDAIWMGAPDTAADTELRVGFLSPSGTLAASSTQEFRARVRKAGGANNPTVALELWESGSLITTLISGVTVSTSQVVAGTWNPSLLSDQSGAGVELRLVGTASGGNPSKRATVEVGAVEWNAVYDVPSVDRAVEVSWAEVEAPLASRAVELSWAEVEAPLASRAAQVSWVEVEVPTLALSAEIAWTEIEVPDAPRAAEVAWSELEVPTFVAGAAAEVSWTELELPLAARAAEVGWAEIEVPTAPRNAQVSWAEMEAPLAPRAAQIAWVEVQVPDVGGQQPAYQHFMSLLGVGH